ncbi:PREDICTED: potassium transporter [Prunus dulcis]|uniref:PREDICTED: potassium transporter n=1 Tax=Prunus dulcis TaxID=3755 RepID=A0A5E4EF96_PRUDU|nr:PREDICTED: potassium transporter [Prunus dulcis]
MAQEDVILESATDHQGSQDHDHQQVSDQSQALKAKKLSWQKLRRYMTPWTSSHAVSLLTIALPPRSPFPFLILVIHFLIVEYKELNVFRCVARYGYTDVRNEPFEGLLVENLKAFIKVKFLISGTTMHSTSGEKFDIKVGESDDGLVKDENGNQDVRQFDDQQRGNKICWTERLKQ